jgi:hypothetical protein
MHEMTRILLLTAALLHLPLALAEDLSKEDATKAAADSLLRSVRDHDRADFSQQQAMSLSAQSLDGTIEFKFQDMSTLGRIRKIRNLSLLTLAETDRSRLFVGMNRRGLFGLHFGYTTRRSDNRSLELWRMPYLRTAAPEK